MPDATANFADLMNDPKRWVINRAVPIFEPHTAHFSEVRDGDRVLRPARTVKVTEAELAEIASEMAASEAAGQYGAITAGHLDPAKREADQAEVFGFHRNPRLMKTGPDQKTRLVVDEYLYPDKAKERGQYPYRSADYFPSAKEIFGVAVLKRKPRLKLGTFAYEDAERGECYQYAVPGAMTPPGADTMDAAQPSDLAVMEAETDEPEETKEEKELFDKAFKYFQREYGMKIKDKQPAAPGANPESDAMATDPKNTAPKTDDKADQYAVQYAALQTEVAQYKAEIESLKSADAARKAELEGIRLERDQERCSALLYQLEVEQYQLTGDEKDKEIKKLLALPAAERPDRVQELRSIYAARKVPSGKIATYAGHVEGGDANDPHKMPSYHEAALQYMRDHIGVQYHAAVENVKATTSKA